MTQGHNLSRTEETYLVDKFNFFVTASRFEADYVMRKVVYTEGVADCLAHNDGVSFYNNYRERPVIGVYHWLSKWELCILTEIEQTEAFAPIVKLRKVILETGLAVALIVVILAMFFARAISNGAKWYTPGIFGGAPVYTPDEMGADVDEDGDIIDAEVEPVTKSADPSDYAAEHEETLARE